MVCWDSSTVAEALVVADAVEGGVSGVEHDGDLGHGFSPKLGERLAVLDAFDVGTGRLAYFRGENPSEVTVQPYNRYPARLTRNCAAAWSQSASSGAS